MPQLYLVIPAGLSVFVVCLSLWYLKTLAALRKDTIQSMCEALAPLHRGQTRKFTNLAGWWPDQIMQLQQALNNTMWGKTFLAEEVADAKKFKVKVTRTA